MSNIVAITPDRNVHRKDYTGAFYPEARAFLQARPTARTIPLQINVSHPMPRRLASLRSAVAVERLSGGPIDVLALFCHGWKGHTQFGWELSSLDSPESLDIISMMAPRSAIVLYCCLTAVPVLGRFMDGPATKGGFAAALYAKCAAHGKQSVSVLAHTTKGHTTKNPYVKRFDAETPEGRWLVEPGSPGWREWRKKLQGPDRFFLDSL